MKLNHIGKVCLLTATITLAAGTTVPLIVPTLDYAIAVNENKVDRPAASNLSIFNTVAIIASIITAITGVIVIINYVVTLTNSIVNLRLAVKKDLADGFIEIHKQTTTNKEEILRIQAQIQLGALEAIKNIEGINKDLLVIQKDFTVMQKEVQRLLTILNKRIIYMEKVILNQGRDVPIEPSVFLDIETL